MKIEDKVLKTGTFDLEYCKKLAKHSHTLATYWIGIRDERQLRSERGEHDTYAKQANEMASHLSTAGAYMDKLIAFIEENYGEK